MNIHLDVRIRYMSSGARLFQLLGFLLSLVKEIKINGYGESTTVITTKNGKKKSILSLVQKVNKYDILFRQQYEVVVI